MLHNRLEIFVQRLILLAALLLVLLTPGARAEPAAQNHPPGTQAPPTQQAPATASYRMDVRLDPAAKTVSGTEQITYRNPSEDTLNELWLRLYLKAFSSMDTLWMREAGSESRGFDVDPNYLGDINVQSLRTADGANLLASATLTDTLLQVPLSEPLGPGETIDLEAEWSSTLPRVFARTGFGGRDDTFFMVGQWYPKMAVYDRGRWDTEPWHANAEFFHDFGSYDVSITVPQAYTVAGTGVPAGEQVGSDGTKTVRFTADSVTDFAFAASPDFQTTTTRAGNVEIAVFYLPEHAAAAQLYADTAAGSVQAFSEWFGQYPYPRLTVVDVPDSAAGAGGMEYPTLVTGGTLGLSINSGLLPYVTAHEVGHQWWPMQTATNEGREPWLDEGLTEYSGMRYMLEASQRLGFGPASISAAAFERISAVTASDQPINLPAWEYDTSAYGAIVYNKPALGFWTLESVVGSDRFRQAMQAYLTQYRFKHPTAADFRAALEEELGKQPWFFDDYIAGGGAIDYAIGAITTDAQTSAVTVRRTGAVRVPVDVQITLQSGNQQIETWDGQAESTTLSFAASDPIVQAAIDPQRKLHAEINIRDNQTSSQAQVAPALTLGGRLAFWTQTIAQFFGLFG